MWMNISFRAFWNFWKNSLDLLKDRHDLWALLCCLFLKFGSILCCLFFSTKFSLWVSVILPGCRLLYFLGLCPQRSIDSSPADDNNSARTQHVPDPRPSAPSTLTISLVSLFSYLSWLLIYFSLTLARVWVYDILWSVARYLFAAYSYPVPDFGFLYADQLLLKSSQTVVQLLQPNDPDFNAIGINLACREKVLF